ncbi:MAG: LysM-like peptidoglycan-binding domain-containing protein [Vibrio sp.]
MNLRKKKETGKLEALKEKLSQSDFVMRIVDAWKGLPQLHQRILTVLIPVVLVLLLLPSGSNDTEAKEDVAKAEVKDAPPSRSTVPLIINGEETSATKPKPKPVAKNEKRISLNGSDETEETAEDKPKLDTSGNPLPWNEYTVQSGDTLSKVFRNNDLSLSDLNQILKIQGKDQPLSHIKAGQVISYRLNNRGDLDMLRVEKGSEQVMFFRLNTGGFYRGK